MGGCYSTESDYSRHNRTAANVVSVTGELRQYPLPITVAEVLQFENSSPNSVFLCNSDLLYFDDFIPNLESEEELEPAQIYFVLPTSKLQSRLAAADMAALAVKASVALNATARRNKKARISPGLTAAEEPESNHQIPAVKNNQYVKNTRKVTRSRLQRLSSRRAKLGVRSFRMRLTTINEGSVLVN